VTHAEATIPLWLPAAIYRVLADPETEGVRHRNALAATFNDFSREQINHVVDELIAYGCINETGETERQYGDLSVVPYPKD
jgi:hypothetical protein